MRSQRILLSILLILFAAGAAHAESNRNSGGELPPLVQTAAERMQDWRDGLLTFLARRPNLAGEQLAAIQELGDLDPGFFAPVLDAGRRDLVAKHLSGLGRVLSHQDYLKLLRSFDEGVRVWLIDNELATLEETYPDCNCYAWWDCGGNACKDVTCVHVGGTSHRGRCAGTEPELEL